ncbi:hypothetical protein [Methylocucumis oryzae]
MHKREQTLRCHHCGSRYQPVNTCQCVMHKN